MYRIFLFLLLYSGQYNAQNSIIIPNTDLFKFTKHCKVGYKDTKGAIIVPNIYDAGSEFKNGFAIILVGNKRGYLNKEGLIAIKPQFEDASLFYYGLAAVKFNGKYGYIDTQGKWIINNTLQNAFDFIDGVARVQINNKWGIINRRGQFIVKPLYEIIYDCSRSLIPVKDISGLFGYMNTQGHWVIKPQFKHANSFQSDNLAIVRYNSKESYINLNGEVIGEVPKHREEKERGHD